jgi:hypothetical protein
MAALAAGNVYSFADPLSTSGGSTTGECTVTSVSGTATPDFPDLDCIETFHFNERDSITITGIQAGAATAGNPSYNAIIGGTGRFRKARGEARTFTTGAPVLANAKVRLNLACCVAIIASFVVFHAL